MKKTAVVTVGSTHFQGLVNAALAAEFIECLAEQGVQELIVQFGAGTRPMHPSGVQASGLAIEVEPFFQDIDRRIQSAAIVIAHAGAGSILSVLRCNSGSRHPGPSLIVVPNTALMDSHQQDLARAVESAGWGTTCSPESLALAIRSLDDKVVSDGSPTILTARQSFRDFVAAEVGLL